MSRVYNFELPYVVPNWQLWFMINRLQSMEVWDKLPEELTKKIAKCRADETDLEITSDDLDLIEDDDWEVIANEVGLDWYESDK